MTSTRVLLRDRPSRSLALATDSIVLFFRHSDASSTSANISSASLPGQLGGRRSQDSTPKCIVELSSAEKADLSNYRTISHNVQGTLGLITIDNNVFLSVVSEAKRAATVRPGETVQRILNVDFHCVDSSDFDQVLYEDINLYPTDSLDEDGFEIDPSTGRRDQTFVHPCLSLKKLLSGGSFYYSADFDLTSRLQERSADTSAFDFSAFDKGYLWNSYMIKPLSDFRSRLSEPERRTLDGARLLTSAIRGYASTVTIPLTSSPATSNRTGLPSNLSLISRLSCKRAGTRFNARGVDDDGNVANFVETEVIFWSPSGICFSYVQIRGSVPIFWEQSAGLLPGQQKVQITRSPKATQPAFDKHFEELQLKYGPIHIVNLLSREKQSEIEISERYRNHVQYSSLNSRSDGSQQSEHALLRETEYDFHAETRVTGYEAASGIKRYIQDSADSFGYCLSEVVEELAKSGQNLSGAVFRRSVMILQQQGVFRTNCLDCLDRTNLMQTIISQMALEAFLNPRGERATGEFLASHGNLWADNGDALSKIYAGTGALKSSFTRSGKTSLAGMLADARKSATRVYINNFADKGRQTTMDMLLGRLIGQTPVYLFDPINDYVIAELSRRSDEYTSSKDIRMWAGTFNLNGRESGLSQDLSPWLCPSVDPSLQNSEIVAVGFQEMVELSPQQIMSTDPNTRQKWEKAVKRTLNENARNCGSEEYVLLRGGQLVGASLSIFVKASVLSSIKNVEGSVRKTGMSGMAGNKGAVAIRMDVSNTSICFVTAHLAAGFANYDERNKDYYTISHGLRFQRNRSIDDHDTVVWLGDFNYRIGLSYEKVRPLVKSANYEKLYENDQLNLQMVAGLTFPYYSEARILFAPTYKYDIGSDEYDTSEKARIPAWTDRILRKGNNLKQINYSAAPLRFSDHRPVYATFICTINNINEEIKTRLSNEIYTARKAVVKSQGNETEYYTTAGQTTSDEEDLLGLDFDGKQTGLPPPSSDKRKWWLDNGLPARSTLQPPTTDSVPNPNRPSNPFTASDQPDWIQKRPSMATSSSSGSTSTIKSLQTQLQQQAQGQAQKGRPLTSIDSSTPAPTLPPRRPLPQSQPINSPKTTTTRPLNQSQSQSQNSTPYIPHAHARRTNQTDGAPRTPSTSSSITSSSDSDPTPTVSPRHNINNNNNSSTMNANKNPTTKKKAPPIPGKKPELHSQTVNKKPALPIRPKPESGSGSGSGSGLRNLNSGSGSLLDLDDDYYYHDSYNDNNDNSGAIGGDSSGIRAGERGSATTKNTATGGNSSTTTTTKGNNTLSNWTPLKPSSSK